MRILWEKRRKISFSCVYRSVVSKEECKLVLKKGAGDGSIGLKCGKLVLP